MAKITVKGEKTFEASANQRLVRALEENGVDVMHRCGGNARCTTCRVVFHEGEPEKMTKAELERLEKGDLLGRVRLSCQILCDNDMTVTPVNRLSESDLDDPGPTPEDHITPNPEWVDKPGV